MTAASLRGAFVWAAVPYVPEAPFFLYRVDAEPLELPDARPLFTAARRGDAEFRFLVRGKARPVLILGDRPDPRIEEFLALRLVRCSELTERSRAAVLAQQDEALYHVPRERTPALEEDFAVMIAAPVRVHETAVDTANVLGRLEPAELRSVHASFVRVHGLDVLEVVRDELGRLRRGRAR